MRTKIQIMALAVVAVLGLGSTPAQAQYNSKFLDRFDVNKDGKISRGEVPEGDLRRTWDRLAEKYGLDPTKVYTRQELKKMLEIAPSAGSSGPSEKPSGSRSSRSGSRPESSRSSSGSSASRTSSDGQRPYRAMEELPEEYKKYDKDGDGQIGLYEWVAARRDIAEFIKLDLNGDGFLTPSELKKAGTRDAKKEDKREEKKDEKKEETKDAKPSTSPPAGEPSPQPVIPTSSPETR